MKITYKEFFTRYIDDDFLDKHYDYKNNNIDLDSIADPETIINTNDGNSTELSEIWRVFGFKHDDSRLFWGKQQGRSEEN